ncbi:leucine-rich repeat domain-containing protein [Leptospira interrogans]|nr:leucine-rich repeat domain-containing protein [Leptospira interrogans]EMN73006.1 leucine rich repeat protein [Leptospira interrogans serovar Bataviae str. UI 08561]EJP12921.1 leucine rich repeat protein [Leptospira interrogans str. FPW2026]EMN67656.1 leucine rich repeat protein [Leptospira interrogans serovar Grippotyphosa str. UI 08434]UMQ59499.1 leucine-rich repeat domain-containing protein [Leptospira interrogans]UNE68420.1 leucine-rich repeat domain-containing protein [Leptospira interr
MKPNLIRPYFQKVGILFLIFVCFLTEFQAEEDYKGSYTNLTEALKNPKDVRILYLSHNQLTTLPEEIGQLQNLQTLLLNYSQLTTLPKEIGQLKNLQELDLSASRLTILPKEIGQLQNLQYLDLNDRPTHDSSGRNQTATEFTRIEFG